MYIERVKGGTFVSRAFGLSEMTNVIKIPPNVENTRDETRSEGIPPPCGG